MKQKYSRRTIMKWLLSTPVLFMPSFASAGESVNIGIDNWAPYESTRISKFGVMEYIGTSVEITNKILENLGLTPNYESRPWARALKELQFKKKDIVLSGRKTKQREKDFFIPKRNYGCMTWQVYTKPNSPELQRKIDLEGKLGVIDSYQYPEKLKSLFKKINKGVPDNINLLRMLSKDRFDYAILDKKNAEEIAEKEGIELFPVENTIFFEPIFPFLRRDWEHVEAFNRELLNLDENIILEILNKYGVYCPPNLPNEGIFAHELNQ